ncbi:MAG: amidohydrolase family protein [Hellea sp.]|nr:amidohydrolase family protein [Hellea sp.]
MDVRTNGKIITEIAPHLEGVADIDGKGGALLPGLHDHHIHLNATAAAMNSMRCGPPEVMTEDDLIKALDQPGEGFLRGVGYHHSVAGEINRDWLDANGPDRPVRIQHRSGRLWILNSRAMDELGIKEPKDGRLYDSDHIIRRSGFPDLTPLIKRLRSYGIVGVTEVTPSNGIAEFENYLEQAGDLNLSIMGKAELTGVSHPRRGHLKLHYHDHDLPALADLARVIGTAHDAGRAIAAHCVTRAELMMTLAAIEKAGPIDRDRIEHAAIADEAAIEWMQRLGVIVVTQPNFIAERRAAYLKDVPEADHPHLWRLKSFLGAGLPLAAGSDAPFGDPNPWAAMAAAVKRPKGFEAESITPEEALALYTKPAEDAGGEPRRVAVGEPADLILLDRGWDEARKDLGEVKMVSFTS